MPFPRAHLSSINVNGVEVRCYQGSQHEEEANEAGAEEEAEEVIVRDTEVPSQSPEPQQDAASQLA